MKKILFALALATTHAHAVLPPLWQGVAELKAILDDKSLGDAIPSGDVILKINKDSDGYTIVTNKREVHVKVDYQPQDHPGPAKFNIRFQ